MNGLFLFARLRRWRTNLIVAVCSGLIILLVGPIRYSLNPSDGYLIAVVSQAPLLSAVLLQASSISPLRAQERHATKSLRHLRAVNYVVLTGVAALILGLSASLLTGSGAVDQDTSVGSLAVVRNFCALAGAGFIGASLFGPSLGWTLPTAWTIFPYVMLTQSSTDNEVITLVAQPDNSFPAFAVGVIVWMIGLVLVSASRDYVLDVPKAIGRMVNAARRGRSRKLMPSRV